MTELTQEVLKELLDYDTETGIFTWKERDVKWFKNKWDCNKFNKRFANTETGTPFTDRHGKSYLKIMIFYKSYAAHRLAYFYMTGEWPVEVDHEDGNGLHNWWSNLRNVDSAENHKNVRKPSSNTSGFVGVRFDEYRRKWCASIRINGKATNLGRFNSKDEAILARQEANIKYGYHVNHGTDRPL